MPDAMNAVPALRKPTPDNAPRVAERPPASAPQLDEQPEIPPLLERRPAQIFAWCGVVISALVMVWFFVHFGGAR